MAEDIVATSTPDLQPDPHRGWLGELAQLHAQAAREVDDEANERLMVEVVVLVVRHRQKVPPG